MVNTSETLLIKRSAAKLIIPVIAALLLAALGAGTIYLGVVVQAKNGGGLGIMLLGAGLLIASGGAAVLFIKAIISKDSFVLRLTPQGFTDKRYSNDEIPWGAVKTINSVRGPKTPMVMVKIDPQVEAQLQLNTVPRILKSINKVLGGGIGISPTGLTLNLDQLHGVMNDYARQNA